MKKLLIILLLASSVWAADTIETYDTFQGGVDVVSPDKLDKKYSPFDGLLNVRTDRFSQVRRRNGSEKYNSTALPGLLAIRNMFVYDKTDGNSYMIVNSSESCFYTKDGNFTVICSSLDPTYIDDYCAGNGVLFRDNGNNGLGGYWDGVTYSSWSVTNSTAMVCARYNKYWYRRYWKASVSGARNTIFYSDIDQPGYMIGFVTLPDIGGDYITGMLVWGKTNSLIVTQKYHTYEIIEDGNGGFTYSQLSNEIGCLYQTTMAILKEYPIWLSARGVEMFTGTGFTLMSESIDNFVRGLTQINFGQTAGTIGSATDWGNGSGVNIDTTTYSSSLSIRGVIFSTGIYQNTAYEYKKYYPFFTDLSNVRYRQPFCVRTNTFVNEIKTLYYKNFVYSSTATFEISLRDKNLNVIVSSNVYVSSTTPGNHIVDITFEDKLLTPETYYIYLSSAVGTWYDISDFEFNFNVGVSSTTDLFPDFYLQCSTYNTANWYGTGVFDSYNGDMYCEPGQGSSGIGNWFGYSVNVTTGYYRDLNFGVYFTPSSGTYTSSTQTIVSWGSWGNFTVDETKPTGSSITHYLKTSTATDNFSTRPLLTVTNNNPIPTTVGPYWQYIASFTRTNSSVIPMVNEVSLYSYCFGTQQPFGYSYKDRYYLAVSTDNSTQKNNMVLVLQQDGTWVKDTGNVGAATVYRNQLYTGDSTNTGYIYSNDKSGVFTDNGINYLSRWTSNIYAPNPLYRTLFKELWIDADNTGGSANIGYQWDGSTTSWTTKSLSLTNPYGGITTKIPLELSKHKKIQFKIESNGSDDFRIGEFYLLYDNTWGKE